MTLLSSTMEIWKDLTNLKRSDQFVKENVNIYNINPLQSNIAISIEQFLDPYDSKEVDSLRNYKAYRGTIRQLKKYLLGEKAINLETSANIVHNIKDIDYYKESNHAKTQCQLYVKRAYEYLEDGFNSPIQPVPDTVRYLTTLNDLVYKTQTGCSKLVGYDIYGIFSWDDVIYYKNPEDVEVSYQDITKYKYRDNPYNPTQVDSNLEVY